MRRAVGPAEVRSSSGAEHAGKVRVPERGHGPVTDPPATGARVVGAADGQRVNPDRAESHALLDLLADLEPDDPRRAETRNRLTTLHLPLAEHLARRFAGRGEPYEDLVQVATIGLIKAIDRYDPTRGAEFSTYATPTILGEIKRWFRDKGWAIRVPRRLQELRLSISSATTELLQQLGRSPTIAELAKATQ